MQRVWHADIDHLSLSMYTLGLWLFCGYKFQQISGDQGTDVSNFSKFTSYLFGKFNNRGYNFQRKLGKLLISINLVPANNSVLKRYTETLPQIFKWYYLRTTDTMHAGEYSTFEVRVHCTPIYSMRSVTAIGTNLVLNNNWRCYRKFN